VNTESLPCGCPIVESLFDHASTYRLITIPPGSDEVAVVTPGSVWCAQGHGWQTPHTVEEFERLAAVVA
jgi:hypothetical protein